MAALNSFAGLKEGTSDSGIMTVAFSIPVDFATELTRSALVVVICV